jgi:MinD-like ATPase involved in chromosome partitioning or flagellar assembly
VSEIDPSTPPHGTDLSALRGTGPRHGTPEPDADPAAPDPAATDPSAPDPAALDPDRSGPDDEPAARPHPVRATNGHRPAPQAPAAGEPARPAEAPEGRDADRPDAAVWTRPEAGADTRTRPDARAGTRAAAVDPTIPEPARPAEDPDLPPPPAARAARPRWTAPDAVEAREAQRRRSEQDGGGDLEFGTPLMARNAKRPPRSGWRRVVYVLTRGYLNPGESPADIRERELTARVNKPLLSSHKIAMLSLKGGVGKTTVTATLGSTFASLRGDRVVAVDANPDRGTLSQKIPLETTATVRHLLRDAQRVRRYTDVRAYTSQGSSRLEVLASEQDPAVSEAFSEDDYRRAVDLLEHFYNLVLTDCGTGLMHSAMYGVLGMADQLVIVSSGSIDGARSASATLDWLDAHGNGDLVRNAVVVINTVHRRGGSGVDLERVAEHFAGRCRAVVRVPFDGHLEEGAEIDLDRLEPGTRTALLELAAAVADGFPS